MQMSLTQQGDVLHKHGLPCKLIFPSARSCGKCTLNRYVTPVQLISAMELIRIRDMLEQAMSLAPNRRPALLDK